MVCECGAIIQGKCTPEERYRAGLTPLSDPKRGIFVCFSWKIDGSAGIYAVLWIALGEFF